MRVHPRRPEIIYRPELQPRPQRLAFSGITVMAWAVWFYLFLPLLSVLAWWLGAEYFAHYMLEPGGRGYFVTLTGYAVVIAIAALIILGWSRYNQFRFSGRDRRAHQPDVSDEMTSARFHVRPEMLERIRASQVMEFDLDAHGRIEQVRERDLSAAGHRQTGSARAPD